jgi:ABC-type uncharacterized transport system permease subunit
MKAQLTAAAMIAGSEAAGPTRRIALPSVASPALQTVVTTAALFCALASGLFWAIGHAPSDLFSALFDGVLGSGFAFSETLVKAAPILLCSLATALPGRLGLISVGGEGQLAIGAVGGTALVLSAGDRLGALTLPAMLLAAAIAGTGYGVIPGLLRAKFRVNETISTLLLNYIAPPCVDYLVYGRWKDPQSLGWPSTIEFPDAARLPTFFGTRIHLGLFIGIVAVIAVWFFVRRTRPGLVLDLLRSCPELMQRAGISWSTRVVALLALGGACAGIAGIAEASVIEGRLQSGVGAGAGYSGFLVACLARGNLLAILPCAWIVASLAAAGDNLQLSAGLPSSIVYVLQGLLFASALIAQARTAQRMAAKTEVAR